MQIESLCAARRRLLMAMEDYQNEDGIGRERAIDAIASGRAAFWHTVQHNDTLTLELVNHLNRGLSLQDAFNTFPGYVISKVSGTICDRVIPLNNKAALMLMDYYGIERADAEDLIGKAFGE